MWLTNTLLGLLSLIAAADPATTQKKDEPKDVWQLSDAERDEFVKTKWGGLKIEHEIQVLNARREPLAGAKVRITGIVPLARTTDAEGRFHVTVPYILQFSPLEALFGDPTRDRISPILNVDFVIDHPDYPVTKCRVESKDRKQTFIVEEGGRLQLIARLDGERTPVRGLIPYFNSGQGIRWSEEDGLLTIRRIDKRESSQVRLLSLVHLPDSGPPWFSDVVDPRELAKDGVPRTLVLKRGVDLTGRISDDIPRPVQNGWVMALVRHEKDYQRLSWMVTAPLAADGTFTLPTLPQAEQVQLVAVCDGWVSQFQTSLEAEREAGHRLPENRPADVATAGMVQSRFYRMDPRQPLQVPMERTQSFEIEVVDAESRPLPGVTFFCHPNFSFDGWGSSHLEPPQGSMIDYFRKLKGDADPPPPTPKPGHRIKVVSDENGIARFNGIPCPKTNEDEPLQLFVTFDNSRHIIPGSLLNPVNIEDSLIYADISAHKVMRKKVRLTPIRDRVADQRP